MRPPANILLLILAAAAVLVPVQAFAVSTTFNFAGTDGGTRFASAEFVLDGSTLQLTLANTSPFAAHDQTYILTAVFFDLLPANPLPVLTPSSAVLAPGSVAQTNNVNNSPQPAGGVVGGEWAYAHGADANHPLQYNSDQGISSAGFGLFGAGNFPGPNLEGPVSVDGVQYGLVGPAGIANDASGGLGKNSVIRNAAVFTLTDGDLTGYTVGNVVFQYGTDLCDPHFVPGGGGQPPPVPEPLTVIGVFAGLCGLAGYVRKRTRA